jgi:hypothetical protein
MSCGLCMRVLRSKWHRSGELGILFLGLSLAMAIARAGWFMRRSWGWFLAVVLIAVQVAGDLVNTVMGQYMRGGRSHNCRSLIALPFASTGESAFTMTQKN